MGYVSPNKNSARSVEAGYKLKNEKQPEDPSIAVARELADVVGRALWEVDVSITRQQDDADAHITNWHSEKAAYSRMAFHLIRRLERKGITVQKSDS